MNKTLDTTAIIKGILEPRRKKKDTFLEEQLRIYRIASSIMDDIYEGKDKLFIPTISVVEIAAVAARLTGDKNIGSETADLVRNIATRIVNEAELLDEAISIAAETKTSGFDSIFIACAKATNSILITDDRRMYETALKLKIPAKFLRNM